MTIKLSFAIDRQTQQFLREMLPVYTPADIAALVDLKAKLDQILPASAQVANPDS